MRSMEDRYPSIRYDDAEIVDGIVVLGGMSNTLINQSDRVEFQSSVDRILAGVELLKKGKGQFILITGGSGLILGTGEREAIQLKRWLIRQGIPEEKIIVESESRNTAENAMFTKRILEKQGRKKVLLVTSAFHMYRSHLIFQKAGLDTVPFPVDFRAYRIFPGPEAFFPTPQAMLHSTYVIKEYLGILAYWWKGYI